MVSITLSVPEGVKRRMEHFSEINWSGFIRKAIIEKTDKLTWKEEMLKKLKQEEPLTEWAVKLQRDSRKGRFEELKKKGLL
ncbi:hypothetical protein COT48_01735 [Candidatus Woesearchaeota archaeon CG08_land_8_20_14_0_20_47_9]|nr:MAG: hypothetical protein COT48_01735 [Candidatus Woesearchaeota archaeon CG08_land_8_20_14_0_20_47_9]HII30051.1 hypothetical protein [Candidatus Woesearchaeota archaeon]